MTMPIVESAHIVARQLGFSVFILLSSSVTIRATWRICAVCCLNERLLVTSK